MNMIKNHSVKSIRIRSFSGLYSVLVRENTDQKNSEYRHFLRSELNPFQASVLPLYPMKTQDNYSCHNWSKKGNISLKCVKKELRSIFYFPAELKITWFLQNVAICKHVEEK